MKVFIRNKFLSLGGSSEVLNEQKAPIFKVKGKIFSPTRKKKIYDMEGNLLYVVRNKYWNFLYNRTFIYDADKNRVATIKKNKWGITGNYAIEDTVDGMSIEGKFWGLTSKIMRNGQVVGVITRNITLINDAFTLEADEKDMPFLTSIVIAFDNIKDKRREDAQ